MVDQWGPLPIAQQFPAVAPDGITKLLDVIARIRTDVTESRASILSSVAKIVGDLTAKQAALDAANVTLAAQQVTLTAQVASINTLIGQQVTSAVPGAPGTGSGFNVGTSWGTKASTTIAVPAGFSQALVFVAGSLIFDVTAPEGIYVRCGIAGNYGMELQDLANTVSSTSVFHSLTLAGLAGGTILLEVQGLASPSSTNSANQAVVTGFAVFFR